MLAVTPEALTELEAATWIRYFHQRIAEIKELNPDVDDSLAERLAWSEFLQFRWAFSARNPFPNMSPLDYGLKMQDHGPDLRALTLSRTAYVKSPAFKTVQVAQKKPKKTQDGHEKGRFTSVYHFFVKKRVEAMKADGQEPARSGSSLFHEIAHEWSELDPEAKLAIAAEWQSLNEARTGEDKTDP
jgi:hypothetical protein